MANRQFVYQRNLGENPRRRRPAANIDIPPGLPPADGQAPPQGWTPVRIECPDFRRPDGTPEVLLLYGRPCSPNAAARQQQDWDWADRAAAEQQDRTTTRRTPEPHEVEGATRVVRLAEMLSLDELLDDDDYQDALADFTAEARRFGDLVKVVVPRPGRGAADPVVAGGSAGKVFLEYACLDDSIQCRIRMDGRWYGGKMVVAGYYPQDRFDAGDYDG